MLPERAPRVTFFERRRMICLPPVKLGLVLAVYAHTLLTILRTKGKETLCRSPI
jgi:hypothetical protein